MVDPDFIAPEVPRLRFEGIDLPGVNDATDFAFLPGAERELLVLSHDGEIHHLSLDQDTASRVGSSRVEVLRQSGCGLLTLALDPAFADNSFVYLTRCNDVRTSSLTRHVFDPDGALTSAEVEILKVAISEDPPEIWHRFGSIGFEPDGETMWVLLGDHFLRANAQETSTPFGSLLRIVPDRTENGSGYFPASGNAFMPGEGEPSIYAYGFRSPWRATRDSRGRFFVGDVGEYRREEVNLVSGVGQNFGWPAFEGACSQGCSNYVNPIAAYGRTSDEPYVFDDPETNVQTRRAVWVGDIYEGPSVDRYYGLFDGRVMFGDFYTGWVRALLPGENGGATEDRAVGHLTGISAWHLGPRGYMYALTLDGTLHRARQVLDSDE